jgi:MFS family permease
MGEEMQPEAVTEAEGSRYRYFVVAMLGLVYTMSFLDRQILSILAEPIKIEMQLSDTQIGLLSGAMFAIFYGLFGIPVAWLADRSNRVRIVAIACLLWSGFACACGFATNFAQLALARVGVAVAEGGGSPASYSIISDYFPPKERATALALYSLGSPVGTAIGAAAGGWLASLYGWRVAFIFAAAPGILVALILHLVVREPRRGRYDPPLPEAPPRLMDTIALFRRSPVLIWTTIGAALSTFVGYGMLSWSATFLIREKGMEMTEIAAYYSIASGLSVGAGMLISGRLADHFGQRDARAYGWVPAIAFAAAVPFFIGMVLAPSWPIALALMVIPCAMYTMWLAPALTIIQNSVLPSQRGTASAIMLFLSGIFGLSGGPVMVGWISDRAAEANYAPALTIGMACLAPFFILAAGAHLMSGRALGQSVSPDAR